MFRNSQLFFEDFVVPAVKDWTIEPLSVRRATIAFCEINNLAEHFIGDQHPGADRKKINEEREKLVDLRISLGVARDIHDTHKHGKLSRKSARIRQGQPPQIHSYGQLQVKTSNGFEPIEGELKELIIVLDDARPLSLTGMMNTCLDFWRKEFLKRGVSVVAP